MSAHRSAPRLLPPLLPAPRHVERAPGTFRLEADIPVVLPPAPGRRIQRSADRLCDAIETHTGLRLAQECHRQNQDLGPHIQLHLDPELAGAPDPERGAEGYRLTVEAEQIRASAATPRGLRYAVETLVQLLSTRPVVPACRIEDHPDMRWRGIMLDVSRGKVPTLDDLKALVLRCASLKINQLMLYVEHTFQFRRHPDIGRGCSPLDALTIQQLDAFAHEHCVELIPSLQSLGHMAHILKIERYRHLAETPRGWTLATVDPGSYALISDLYEDHLPNFRSPWFNANCDEPWDLGEGRSAARTQELGKGLLYVEHVHRVRDMAARHGKRTMVWSDVLHSHPEVIEQLDDDVVVLDWWYEAELDYDRVARFGKHGREFVVCPGTSSWNSLFPRVENSLLNISRWAQAGREHGALGLLNTDWGDHGHYNLLGNSLLAYAWGAQESWSGPTERASFDRAFSRSFFGDARGAVARLYRELGDIHGAGFTTPNGSPLQHLFFDDLESARFIQRARTRPLLRSRKKLEQFRLRIARVREEISLDPLTLAELAYAADASLLAVDRTLAGLAYLQWCGDRNALNARARRHLAVRLEELTDAQRSLGRSLRKLWCQRSHISEFAYTRTRLDQAVRSMRAAAKRLRNDRPAPALTGSALDTRGALEAVLQTTPPKTGRRS